MGQNHRMFTSRDPLENFLGTFPCARLRGLSFEASLEDVLLFFQGLVVLDVVVLAEYGVGSSESFVLFANPMDFQMALLRNGQRMNQRFIEVSQGRRSDYYAAIASKYNVNNSEGMNDMGEGENNSSHDAMAYGSIWTPGTGIMPSQSLRAPLSQKGSNVGASKTSLGTGPNNNSGNSKLPLSSLAQKAGRGAGEGRVKNGAAGRGSGRGGGIQVGEHTGYLRMRGLPFTSTKADIAEFFKVYHPIEDSIALTYRSDGRATGEGYIAFHDPEDAKSAMSLHRNTMGSRYIELFISNKEEHSRAQARENVSR